MARLHWLGSLALTLSWLGLALFVALMLSVIPPEMRSDTRMMASVVLFLAPTVALFALVASIVAVALGARGARIARGASAVALLVNVVVAILAVGLAG